MMQPDPQCPECHGTGLLWYTGTTGPAGDDPSDTEPCPCTLPTVIERWQFALDDDDSKLEIPF